MIFTHQYSGHIYLRSFESYSVFYGVMGSTFALYMHIHLSNIWARHWVDTRVAVLPFYTDISAKLLLKLHHFPKMYWNRAWKGAWHVHFSLPHCMFVLICQVSTGQCRNIVKFNVMDNVVKAVLVVLHSGSDATVCHGLFKWINDHGFVLKWDCCRMLIARVHNYAYFSFKLSNMHSEYCNVNVFFLSPNIICALRSFAGFFLAKKCKNQHFWL